MKWEIPVEWLPEDERYFSSLDIEVTGETKEEARANLVESVLRWLTDVAGDDATLADRIALLSEQLSK